MAQIKAVITELPSYRCRRAYTILKRQAWLKTGQSKRVYRVTKVHSLLLDRHAGGVAPQWHEDRIAVDECSLGGSTDITEDRLS